jgi:hypothetical protein
MLIAIAKQVPAFGEKSMLIPLSRKKRGRCDDDGARREGVLRSS